MKIKIGNLVAGQEIRTRAMVIQQKTDRPVQFELMSDARSSLLAWLERRGGTVDDYAFPSRTDPRLMGDTLLSRSGTASTRQSALRFGDRQLGSLPMEKPLANPAIAVKVAMMQGSPCTLNIGQPLQGLTSAIGDKPDRPHKVAVPDDL